MMGAVDVLGKNIMFLRIIEINVIFRLHSLQTQVISRSVVFYLITLQCHMNRVFIRILTVRYYREKCNELLESVAVTLDAVRR